LSRLGAVGAVPAALLLTACVSTSTQWRSAALDVRCGTPGVLVVVDGRPVGLAGAAPIALPTEAPAVQLELRREGFVTRRLDLAVQTGRLHVVTVELWPAIPELDAGR
jgi:hypothetical protein